MHGNKILRAVKKIKFYKAITTMQSDERLLARHTSQHPPYLPQPSLQASRSLGGGESMKCLLVRHLPSWLSREEKESLLSHFGAQEVIVMPNRGKMVTSDNV